MSYVIKLAIAAGVAPTGALLKSFDVDAADGRGSSDWTGNADEALLFDSAALAMAAWNAQSTVRPLRPDGKPNKPMTAFTVEIVEAVK